MKNLFPSMYSRPRNFVLSGIASYWVLAFMLIPWCIPLISTGLWDNMEFLSWVEIVYHALNALVLLWILKGYLKDEWFMVTTAPGHYLSHGLLAVALMVAVAALQSGFFCLLGADLRYMLNGLPVTEMSVAQTAGLMVTVNPVVGTACMVLLAPISVCALFYALGFAPVCCNRPWLAYLLIIVVTLIPSLIDIAWRGDAALVMDMYCLQLPIHLIACWAYQKTDNIFTSMLSLAIINLLGALANILLA